jgi:PKD repeat protein
LRGIHHTHAEGRPPFKRLLALALVLAGILAATASTASALIAHLANGKALSYQPLREPHTIKPFDAFFSNLDYNGGPVMPSNTNYAIYWRPSGAPAYPAGYQEGVNRYLTDLGQDSSGHENVDSVSAQYNDATGEFANYNSNFGRAPIDTDPYPANGCAQATICLTDEQIQTELKAFVEAQRLPTDLEHEYFLLTPPAVESCFMEEVEGKLVEECSAGSKKPVFCAYHGNAPIESSGEVVGELIYSDDPYVTGISGCDTGNHPNGSPSDGVIQGGLSHEHNESITDPLPNGGWTDFATGEESGYEIGDKCDTGREVSEFGSALGEVEVEEGGKKVKAKYNQVVNGHFYWYQQEWSNQGYRCLQRLTFAGAEPSATFVSKPAGGDKLTFEAGQSSAPGGVVRYSWEFNDSKTAADTAETTTPAVTHTFPKAGFYAVALTVYAADGTSLGSEDIVETSHTSPSAAFAVSTAAPAATAPTQFEASISNGLIQAYEWNFGDGSGGRGQTPSHTYAKPGTYSVTLLVEDTFGQVVTVSHQVTVASPPSEGGSSGGGFGESPTPPPPIGVAVQPVSNSAIGTITLLGTNISIGPKGTGQVKLSCTGTGACTGKLTLAVKVKGRNKRTRTVTLGSASFSIAAGATGSVTLKLTAAGRSRLRAAHGHLSATLSIAKSSPAPASTQTRGVQLRLKLRK